MATSYELASDASEAAAKAALPKGTRLTPPNQATKTRINWSYTGTFLSLHLLTLLVFVPWFFSWVGFIAFFLGVILFGQFAIPIGYHRLLTHHSFKTPKWFERTLATLAMCAGQETPARWVAWHRVHHLHSDHHEDPHTPLVSFFWSHMNWLVYEHNGGRKTFALYEKYARDILRDPYYMWMEKIRYASPIFFIGHAILYAAVAAVAMVSMYGWGDEALRMTASIFLWGVIARTVWVWHITWAVNSLTHLFGYRNFDTPDGSRNNWFVTLLTSGEGWHNNHHADQASATVQIRWWEIDINYYVIKLLGKIGLATNIVPPRHIREANRKRQMQKQAAA